MVKNSYSYLGVVAALEVHSSHLPSKGTLRQRMLLADTFGTHYAVHAKAVLAKLLLVNDRGHWGELEVGHFCPVQDSSRGNALCFGAPHPLALAFLGLRHCQTFRLPNLPSFPVSFHGCHT